MYELNRSANRLRAALRNADGTGAPRAPVPFLLRG